MKKIIYILTAFLSLGITSCSLDEESYVDVDKNNFMNNAKEAEMVLLGVYRNLVNEGLYGFHLSCVFDLTNDLAYCEGNTTNGPREVPSNSFNKSNKLVEQTWQQLYAAIYTANDFIENITHKKIGYSESDQQLAEIYIGEAKALRALFYLEFLRWYGNIPLVLTPEDSDQEPAFIKQEKPEVVYAQIEKDLHEAIAVLPWVKDNDRPYRMSKNAAYGLMTRMYATWAGYPVHDVSKWECARDTARALIESGQNTLLSDYEQLWKNTCNGKWNSDESLIEVSFYAPTYTGNSSLDAFGRIGKWNGVENKFSGAEQGTCGGMVKVAYTFVQQWQQKISSDTIDNHPEFIDQRYNLSLASYRYDKADGKMVDLNTNKLSQLQNWTPRKWDIHKYVEKANQVISNDYSNVNWYVLRYADVLLLYAEAINETEGPTAAAYEAINQVRRRGYGQAVETAYPGIDLEGLSQEEFRQAIRNERAYELCFEGQRRQDLVRWGIYYESIKETDTRLQAWWLTGSEKNPRANYIAAYYTVKGKHELFPIPQREMDLMPLFVQNPQW